MPRKWKLLKDTLVGEDLCCIVDSGLILTDNGLGSAFGFAPKWGSFGICKAFIETHPEWFEEIEPRKVLVIEIPIEFGMPDGVPKLIDLRFDNSVSQWRAVRGKNNWRIEERE